METLATDVFWQAAAAKLSSAEATPNIAPLSAGAGEFFMTTKDTG